MKKIKIMVIDDSPTICKSAEYFLKNDSIEVILVTGQNLESESESLKNAAGFEALSRIIEEMPDLIFMDVLMPTLDGLQTCQIIKRNPDFKKTPIIFMSSKDSEFDKARGFMVGADDYLVKPFLKDQIINMVKKYTNLDQI